LVQISPQQPPQTEREVEKLWVVGSVHGRLHSDAMLSSAWPWPWRDEQCSSVELGM